MRRALPSLQAQLPVAFDLWSSPALRCQQLAAQLSPTSQTHPWLQELDFGAWEGMRWDDIPRANLDAWATDIWHYRPGGGESAADVRARWQQFLQLPGLRASTKPQVIITHAGVIRMALSEVGLIPPQERWQARIDYMTPYQIDD